jgi:hypothetical protein
MGAENRKGAEMNLKVTVRVMAKKSIRREDQGPRIATAERDAAGGEGEKLSHQVTRNWHQGSQ